MKSELVKNMSEQKIDQSFYRLLKQHDADFNVLKCSKLKGDASTRMYFRLIGENTSYLIQQNVDTVYLSRTQQCELFCLRSSELQKIGIPTPVIFQRDKSAGLLLQQDLGDANLQSQYQANEDLSLYEGAIDLLYTLKLASDKNDRSFYPQFTKETYLKEMQELLVWHGQKFTLSDEDRHSMTLFFELVANDLSLEDLVLCHRDFHSRNLMYFNKQLYVIDFQDMFLGHAFYDLVSLLWDPYAKLKPEQRAKLLDYWHEKKYSAVEKKINYKALYASALQRIFKAMTSYAKFFVRDSNTAYLDSFYNAFSQVEALLELYKGDVSKSKLFNSALKRLVEQYKKD